MAAAMLRAWTRDKPRGTALIVEDSLPDAALLASFMAQLGFAYKVARDGAEGVQAALEGDYDFILMDIEMPNLDGCEATKAIHAMMGPRSPFIVAVTSHTGTRAKKRCEEAGIDYMLSKPVRLSVIAKLLAD